MTSDLSEFERAVGDFLLADPVRNNLPLSVIDSLRTSGADAFGEGVPRFGWYEDSEVCGAFLQTPPMAAFMTDAPARAARSLVEALDGAPGLMGPVDAMRTFAEAWQAAKGHAPKTDGTSRLFRLAELTPPDPVPAGRVRLGTAADRELMVDWFTAFHTDAGETTFDAERGVDRRLDNGALLLWEDDGIPVSLAGATAAIAGVVRVAPVYTPVSLRGRGYAGAVTAALSRRARGAGHEVVLFTDLANPTSNALYQRLGYRPIGDWMQLELA